MRRGDAGRLGASWAGWSGNAGGNIPAGHCPVNALFPWVVMAGCSLACAVCGTTGQAPLPRAPDYGSAVANSLAAHKHCADARPTAAELFPEELEEYLRASIDLAREEARIVEEYEHETIRLRRESGWKVAELLGLDPRRYWEPAAVMMLSPKLEWRLRACRHLLDALRAQPGERKERVA